MQYIDSSQRWKVSSGPTDFDPFHLGSLEPQDVRDVVSIGDTTYVSQSDRLDSLYGAIFNGRKEELNVAVVGIGHLFGRSLAGALGYLQNEFPNLRGRLKITAVDVREGREDGSTDGTEMASVAAQVKGECGLEISRYYNNKFFDRLVRRGDLRVDGVYIATPPDHHLSAATTYLQMTTDLNSFVAVEKPVVVPSQLGQERELVDRYGSRLTFVDSFVTSLPMEYLLRQAKEDGIQGSVIAPLNRCTEINYCAAERMLVDPGRGGSDYAMIRKRTPADLDRGIFLDVGTHMASVAAVVRQLDEATRNLPVNVTHARFARYLENPSFDDTFGLARATIGNKTIHIQAGKGLDRNVHWLDARSPQGDRVTILFGTRRSDSYGADSHPPLILVRDAVHDRNFAVSWGQKDNRYPLTVAHFLASSCDLNAAELKLRFNEIGRDSAPTAVGIIRDAKLLNQVRAFFGGYSQGQTPEGAIGYPLQFESLDQV